MRKGRRLYAPQSTPDPAHVRFDLGTIAGLGAKRVRLDLVRANQDDAFADLNFGLGGKGYAFLKDQNELTLLKAWNNWESGATFYWTNAIVKNENVTLVLSFTRVGADLRIDTRVLDKANGAVLFERSVLDRPESDPVLPDRAVKNLHCEADPPGAPWVLQSSGLFVAGIAWINTQKAPDTAAQVIVDKVTIWQYESPRLAVQSAIILSWPVTETKFILESARGLDGPWTAVADPWWRDSNGQRQTSVPTTDTASFFRLRVE